MTKSPCAGPLRPALGVAYSRHRPDEPLTMSSCSLAWSFSTSLATILPSTPSRTAARQMSLGPTAQATSSSQVARSQVAR